MLTTDPGGLRVAGVAFAGPGRVEEAARALGDASTPRVAASPGCVESLAPLVEARGSVLVVGSSPQASCAVLLRES